MSGPNADQIWDQNWWNQNPTYGTAPPPWNGPAETPREGGISINPGVPAPGTPGAPGTIGSIKTSITPRAQVYSPQQTQMAVNQAVSDARVSPYSAMKQYDRPGVSRSKSNQYRAAPTIAAGFSLGQQQAAGIPLADEIANQQNHMAGQLAQHQEYTGLAGLLLKQLALQQYAGQSQLGNIGSLLGMLGNFT